LNRSKNDLNVIQVEGEEVEYKFQIFKIDLAMPIITLSDEIKLKYYQLVESGRSIHISFRTWELYEYPALPATNELIWRVKSSTQLEKPRFMIFAFQTGKKNKKTLCANSLDDIKLEDLKVYLNGQYFPYEKMNIVPSKDNYTSIYQMYIDFQKSYYEGSKKNEPLLNYEKFKSSQIIAIDTKHQNESLKFGPIDIKVEIKCHENIPSETSCFCLILSDRVFSYKALTGEIEKLN
jgi:hypothetical protein